MPVTVKKVGSKYAVRTPGGVKSYGTTKAKAKRQATLLRAIEHGWKPTGKPAREALIRAKASALVERLLGERCGVPGCERWERGNVEPTRLKGGRYGKNVASQGKTAGKFRFPRNYPVGHAMKG